MTTSDNGDNRTQSDGRCAASPSVMRSRQMQNPLDRVLFHPLAAYLARFAARLPITPNMISVSGAAAIILAGLAYTQFGWPLAFLAGFALHLSWHVLDGADGDLARLTGKTSPTGEIVDGLSDYLGHAILYLLLAVLAAQTVGSIAWVLAIAAALSRAVQASFYESQRRRFLCWAYGLDWLGSQHMLGGENAPGGMRGLLGRAYLRGVSRLSPDATLVDQAMRDPVSAQKIRNALHQTGPTPMTGSALLGAPYRTLALGAAMAVQSPLIFFLYEAILLNGVLFAAMHASRRTTRALLHLD